MDSADHFVDRVEAAGLKVISEGDSSPTNVSVVGGEPACAGASGAGYERRARLVDLGSGGQFERRRVERHRHCGESACLLRVARERRRDRETGISARGRDGSGLYWPRLRAQLRVRLRSRGPGNAHSAGREDDRRRALREQDLDLPDRAAHVAGGGAGVSFAHEISHRLRPEGRRRSAARRNTQSGFHRRGLRYDDRTRHDHAGDGEQ